MNTKTICLSVLSGPVEYIVHVSNNCPVKFRFKFMVQLINVSEPAPGKYQSKKFPTYNQHFTALVPDLTTDINIRQYCYTEDLFPNPLAKNMVYSLSTGSAISLCFIEYLLSSNIFYLRFSCLSPLYLFHCIVLLSLCISYFPWPSATPLHQKLHGGLEDLKKTTNFITAAGLVV